MKCEKPTGCGDPDVSQYIEYIGFGIFYLAFAIWILRYATKAIGRPNNMLESGTGKALFLNILLVCFLRILISADLWINMSCQAHFFLVRVVYIPFGLALLLLTLSWTRLCFYLRYSHNYQKKLRTFQIVNVVLYVVTSLVLLLGIIIIPLFYAFIISSLMYLYLSILYFVSAFQVFWQLKQHYPLLQHTFGTSLRINASVVSFCILSRVIMNVFIAFTYETLNGAKVRQITDIVLILVCEIIPLFFAFIRMHFEVAENESFRATIAPDNYEADRSSLRHPYANSTLVFLQFKESEECYDGYLSTTVSTKPGGTKSHE